MIEVEVIRDSISEFSPRLFTVRTTYPKFIHQETLRHRRLYTQDALAGDYDFSLSVSSARAIPFKKLLDEVRDDALRAAPVKWGKEQKGMSPGDELSDVDEYQPHDNGGYYSPLQRVKQLYAEAAWSASNYAEAMANAGLHKSICNRIIENYIHVHALWTATEPGWMNFFGLRLDPAADPTLRAVAQAIYKAWLDHTPEFLHPGQWHMPYIDDEYGMYAIELLRMSAARCARLSYLSFETNKRSTIDEDLALYTRLAGSSPIHASPLEHQATPDIFHGGLWEKPHLHGNIPGWIQFRKTIPGEHLAPLPHEP